jgi:dTMP kinase
MFVAFEGIDGSGKTTLSNAVAKQLQDRGLSVLHLRAEGKFASRVSEAVRELGRDSLNWELVPEAEFLLYVARDVQLIEQKLRPALEAYDVVLADRFLFTAQVLGHWGRHLPKRWVERILQLVAGGLQPDLVVLVDVEPTLARARRKSAKLEQQDSRPPSRKGLAGVGLQHRIRRGYLELAAEDPTRWAVVYNQRALAEAVTDVSNLVEAAARTRPADAVAAFRAKQRRSVAQARGALKVADLESALASFLTWIDDRIDREPRVAAHLLSGLWGGEVDLRRRVLAERAPVALLAALRGLDDEESWRIRESLKATHPGAVARSLTSLPNSGRAGELRAELLVHAEAEVLSSLARLDDELSWETRERLLEQCPEVVIAGLAGLDHARAWALRERWLQSVCARLSKEYGVARATCRSITRLASERAAELRRSALGAAPVAAITSLAGVLDDESWSLRRQFLERAPKAVMASLSRIDDERAWAMRRAVADDCKEALDGFCGLDVGPAWELRDRYATLWPSTVVKSLGPLADDTRGRALLFMQLQSFPDNLSLLKHATAIALGVHKRSVEGEDETSE